MTSVRLRAFAFATFFFTLFAQADSTTQTPPPDGLRQNTPRTVFFTHAKIVCDPARTLEDASLLIRDGKIISVGKDLAAPAEAKVYDLTGKTLYAGFIDAYAEWPFEACKAASTSESSRYWNALVAPQLSVATIYRPDAGLAGRWRSQGIVARYVAPSYGDIKGTGSLVANDDAIAADAFIARDVAMHISLNQTEGEGYPDSPMGAFTLVRQAFYDSAWYGQAIKTLAAHPELPSIENNPSLQALSDFAESKKPFVIDTPDEMYIQRTAAIAAEFQLHGIVRSAGYDYRLIDETAKLKMPVIVPLNFPKPPNVAAPERVRSTTLEQLMHWDLAPENPMRLRKAGVEIAFSSVGLNEPGDLMPAIRKAIERGLSREDALAALTTQPAKMFGVDSQLGSIAPGKRASLLIADGDLFEPTSHLLETWVNGTRYVEPITINKPIEGEWILRGGELTLSLKIDPDSKATLTRIDASATQPTSKPAGNFERSANGVSFTIPSEITAGAGVTSVSLVFDGTTFRGSASMPNGSSIALAGERKSLSTQSATQSSSQPSTQPTTQAGTQPTSRPAASFEPSFPLGAFGRNGIPQQPSFVWIRNATVWTSADAGVIEHGEIVINAGKIAYVGAATPRTVPVDAIIVDAQGKHISPGIIDAHSHIATDGGVNEGGQAITCEVRIGDFINSTDINIYRQLAGGVTTSNILHGSANAIGGQNQVIKLRWGALPQDLKFAGAKPGVKFALGENPKQSNWGDKFVVRYPQTRMGVEQIMLDAFEAARDYQRRWNEWESHQSGIPPRRDLELDALVEIINGTRMIHCHSYRADEILALMRTAEKLGFKIKVFQHILEGYKVAPEMQKHGAMASTFSDWWAYKFEVYDAIPYNGALMKQAGLIVSFNSDDAEMARRLNTESAKAVKYGGVEPSEALKFVTINAARQLFVDHHVGSLEVGKDADLVVWSGSPLSLSSRVEQTWIDGRKYFDRADDLADRAKLDRMKQALIQKILTGGQPMAQPDEFPLKPSALLAHDDIYCGHDHHNHE